MSKDNVAIRVSGVSKAFKLPHEKQSSIKGLFVSMFHGKRTYERQQVLKDVSFEVKKGEFFGIVGRNGSGKSTLLKLLSGIYTADKGAIQVNGKLTPFIELGVGFSPDLTGRENVFLNGALLGFSREEMLAMYDEIVEFAELKRFMDQKLKNYSSGMQVRLAFSIAIRANTDILVLDEVLAVGDADFQRKCYEYFKSLKSSEKTVVLVTHDMGAVRDYCDKALLIDRGEIIHIGAPQDVSREYLKLFNKVETSNSSGKTSRRWGNGQVKVIGHKLTADDKLKVEFEVKSKVDIAGVVMGFRFYDSSGNILAGASTVNAKIGAVQEMVFKKNETKKITFECDNILGTGDYRMGYTIRLSDMVTICDDNEDLARFNYNSPESYQPIICPVTVTVGD